MEMFFIMFGWLHECIWLSKLQEIEHFKYVHLLHINFTSRKNYIEKYTQEMNQKINKVGDFPGGRVA